MMHVVDSVTKLGPECRGTVLIAGSHGGVFAAYLAACAGVRGVILSDAGVGLDHAGTAGIAYLDSYGIAAATVDYRTARIGDGGDLFARGRISFVNAVAGTLGCWPGQTTRECAELMMGHAISGQAPPPYEEARFLIRDEPGMPKIVGLDSISLLLPEDAGAIVVTGSHGGLLGGNPESALRGEALAVVFNDAGIGIDEAGISRLGPLAARGIAAVAVDAETARIGEARSSWDTGRISRVNAIAQACGAQAGTSVPEFAALFAGS
jgi:hypothetical protein